MELGFTHIDGEECEWLERSFEEEEVKRVIKCYAGDKALKLDDFSLAFFWQCWNTVKADVMDAIIDFQEKSEFKKSLNILFIVIIPKCE